MKKINLDFINKLSVLPQTELIGLQKVILKASIASSNSDCYNSWDCDCSYDCGDCSNDCFYDCSDPAMECNGDCGSDYWDGCGEND